MLLTTICKDVELMYCKTHLKTVKIAMANLLLSIYINFGIDVMRRRMYMCSTMQW